MEREAGLTCKLSWGFLLSFTQHLLSLTHAHTPCREEGPLLNMNVNGSCQVTFWFKIFMCSAIQWYQQKRLCFAPRLKISFFSPFSFSSCCITITFGAVNYSCEFLVGIRQCLLAGILKKASVIFCLLFVYLFFRASFY